MSFEKKYSIKGFKIKILPVKFEDINKQILFNRNVDQDKNFISAPVKLYWPNINDFPDLNLAIDIIIEAFINHKTIGICGDYDVDGTTSTALLVTFFNKIGLKNYFHIPNRFTEGYGISIPIVEKFLEKNVDIIITADNGTTAYDSINYIKKQGKSIIILDHHAIQNPINADAFVNPQRTPNTSFSDLCAAGVTFIFLVELNKKLFEKNLIENKIDMSVELDKVAVATICDIMQLKNLNRSLVKMGLEKINKNPILGFHRILKEHIGDIDVKSVGFNLGPYLNAPGRFGIPEKTVELLLTNDEIVLEKLIIDIARLNQKRKLLEVEMLDFCIKYGLSNIEDSVIIVAQPNWHEGILGIIAGKLKEFFNKPTCILSINDEKCKGSLRSVEGFHIGNMIKEAVNTGIIDYGGGHSMAGGITLRHKNLEIFREFCNNYYNKQEKKEQILSIDGILSVSAINEKTYTKIMELSPYGEGFREPNFLFLNCLIKSFYLFGTRLNRHCNLSIISGNYKLSTTIFNIQNTKFDFLRNYKEKVHLIGTLSKYREKISLNIIDIVL